LYINIIQNSERRFGCLGTEIGTNLITSFFAFEKKFCRFKKCRTFVAVFMRCALGAFWATEKYAKCAV